MEKIRLSPSEIAAIRDVFVDVFHKHDHLWVFGSRADMFAAGGDIDLYVEVRDWEAEALVEKKMKFLLLLKDRIGDQKIDVVINQAGHDTMLIHSIAKQKGVKII